MISLDTKTAAQVMGAILKEKGYGKNKEALVVLEEVAQYIKEAAEEVDASSEYDEGRLAGYHEALSMLFAQCKTMGITDEDIGMAGYDPDTLVGLKKTA